MATVIGNNQIKLNNGQIVQGQEGGWYDARRLMGGQLLNPGEDQPGHVVSPEVIAQTNPANVAYVNQQRQQQQPTQPVVAPTTIPATLPAGSMGGVGASLTQPDTINLPQLYEGLYANSGIRDIEAQLNEKTNAFNEQVAKIKDNPYLSEATQTGRIKKLEEKFAADTQATKNDIATKKADIETQLNLQTKQFDINSEVAKQALDKFQALLSSGSLAGASGEDIAALTRSTGLSSSMIQSAIKAQQDKNVSTSTIQYDDGKNTGFVIINDKTGEIINKQVVAPSKPKSATVGQTKESEQTQNLANLTQSVKNGITLKSLVSAFYPALSIEDIYRIYNQYSPFGQSKETIQDVKQGKYVT